MWTAFYTVIPGPRPFHLVALPDSIFKFPLDFLHLTSQHAKRKSKAKGLLGDLKMEVIAFTGILLTRTNHMAVTELQGRPFD